MQIERLRSERFDLLVVGGGIIGAGVAERAARHGFSVALVEAEDFASGASSASSKLVHGGLRYLRMGHFSLVREALGEVRALSEIVAPHLVRRLLFVLPVFRGGPAGPLEPLAEQVPETEAEALHARQREWAPARTTDDVLRRRTTLALTGRDSPAVRERVETLLRA
jgi:glycerol-3-phosphate dehydrogenase